jgi:hypothetical protein
VPSTYIFHPPPHRSCGLIHIIPCCRRHSFDTFTPLLSERIIAQSQGLKEEHDSLHTLLRGRGGRFDQPSFCSYWYVPFTE